MKTKNAWIMLTSICVGLALLYPSILLVRCIGVALKEDAARDKRTKQDRQSADRIAYYLASLRGPGRAPSGKLFHVLNVYSSPAEVEDKIGLPDYRYDRSSADSNGPGQLIEYFYLAYTPDNTMRAVVRGKPLRDGFRFGAVEPLKGLADAFLVSHAMKLYSFAFSNGALYQACIDWLGVKVSRDFVWYLSPPGEGYNSDGTPMLPKDVSLWELSPVSRLAQQQTLFCQ